MEGIAGKLQVVCAWCRAVLQVGDPGQPVSHGICAACRKRITRHRCCWHPERMSLGKLVQRCCGCPEERYTEGKLEHILAGGHR